jgi:hypothetical protein
VAALQLLQGASRTLKIKSLDVVAPQKLLVRLFPLKLKLHTYPPM